MEKNIFEGAYFGKPYKTRDGRKAIYLGNDGTLSFHHRLNIEGKYVIGCFNEFGVRTSNNEDNADDIVSEWHEEINEEELDKLGNEYLKSLEGKSFNYIPIKDSFKAGYRKALNS